MKFKHLLCGAVIAGCLFTAHADAQTISADVFTKEATAAQLEIDDYKYSDIMGNQVKGICVKYVPKNLRGFSTAKIFCNNTLETSELVIKVGTDPRGKVSSVPKTLVINSAGTRVDVPIPNYTYDSGVSPFYGPWGEYAMSIPLSTLKDSGVKSIQGISVIMTNPETGIDGNFEPILQQKQQKNVVGMTNVYQFYLKLSATN